MARAAGCTGDDRAAGGGAAVVDVLSHVRGEGGHGALLSNGGTLEHAQRIAAHASPKTTKLYDRTADAITLDEIERIVIDLRPRDAGRSPAAVSRVAAAEATGTPRGERAPGSFRRSCSVSTLPASIDSKRLPARTRHGRVPRVRRRRDRERVVRGAAPTARRSTRPRPPDRAGPDGRRAAGVGRLRVGRPSVRAGRRPRGARGRQQHFTPTSADCRTPENDAGDPVGGAAAPRVRGDDGARRRLGAADRGVAGVHAPESGADVSLVFCASHGLEVDGIVADRTARHPGDRRSRARPGVKWYLCSGTRENTLC